MTTTEKQADGTHHADPLTARTLLDLCNLNHKQHQYSRRERLAQLRQWQQSQPALLALLLLLEGADPKSGCFPLHWAAGSGFDEAVAFLLDHTTSQFLCVDQLALNPSTGRTPLHYAARNGCLSTCQLLIQSYKANPSAKCHRASVTPLQLAVWQNQLEIVQYLVETTTANGNGNGNIILERNDFNCGLQHWIGMIPKHRWNSKDGSGVLPLARYMHQLGLSYSSSPDNQQNHGHTPLHKAAWGGNIALIQYFCHEHFVFDTVQDLAGNYAADSALMGGHVKAHEWLQQYGSHARQQSCEILGLDATATASEIQARYREYARIMHPDKIQAMHMDHNTTHDAFVRIKAAYEHLIHHGGVGSQRNPKHEALRLLTAAKDHKKKEVNDRAAETNGESSDTHTAIRQDLDDDNNIFHARILAVISDYGDRGFPVSLISRRWNQIWPNHPFPSPDNYVILVPSIIRFNNEAEPDTDQDDGESVKGTSRSPETVLIPKRVRLLRFLKWKCKEVVIFRKVDGVELAFQRTRLPEEYTKLTTELPLS
jgi:ankyrin repeat protein